MNIEIERKYIIVKPDLDIMMAQECYRALDITQIYLKSKPGVTDRIRAAAHNGNVTFYKTRKIRLSKIFAYEREGEITEEEFLSLSESIKPGSRPIKKVRHVFSYLGQTFEIDIYPEWHNTCIMETELENKNTVVEMPPFIKIIEEVTGKRGYSNHAMSLSFPEESHL